MVAIETPSGLHPSLPAGLMLLRAESPDRAATELAARLGADVLLSRSDVVVALEPVPRKPPPEHPEPSEWDEAPEGSPLAAVQAELAAAERQARTAAAALARASDGVAPAVFAITPAELRAAGALTRDTIESAQDAIAAVGTRPDFEDGAYRQARAAANAHAEARRRRRQVGRQALARLVRANAIGTAVLLVAVVSVLLGLVWSSALVGGLVLMAALAPVVAVGVWMYRYFEAHRLVRSSSAAFGAAMHRTGCRTPTALETRRRRFRAWQRRESRARAVAQVAKAAHGRWLRLAGGVGLDGLDALLDRQALGQEARAELAVARETHERAAERVHQLRAAGGADGQPVGEQFAGEQPTSEQPASEQLVGDQPVGEQPAEGAGRRARHPVVVAESALAGADVPVLDVARALCERYAGAPVIVATADPSSWPADVRLWRARPDARNPADHWRVRLARALGTLRGPVGLPSSSTRTSSNERAQG